MIHPKFYVALFLPVICYRIAIAQSYKEEIKAWQKELNEHFVDENESPLGKKDRKKFNGLDFFPIDSSYRIVAQFIRTPNELPFNMPTTTDRLPVYVKYGEVTFELKGKTVVLPLYKSQTLLDTDARMDYLFLPFTDETNGIETYGGGRYLDLEVPKSNELIIDFNKSYNPYCAYNADYSCPIPPKENHIPVEINAGVKSWKKD